MFDEPNLVNIVVFELLPFLLNPPNIARFDDGKVIIGDRRAYPLQQSYVTCESVDEVATAIKDMVTQGGGPWLSAVNAMRIISTTFSEAGDGKKLLSELKRAEMCLLQHAQRIPQFNFVWTRC